MKSLYITGDSHAGKMANILFQNIYDSYGPNHVYGTTVSEYYNNVIDHVDPLGNNIYHGMSSHLASVFADNKKITIASTPGRSALNLDYDFYDYTNSWNSEESVVMPWYGYIDIKNWLPQTNLKNHIKLTVQKIKRSFLHLIIHIRRKEFKWISTN